MNFSRLLTSLALPVLMISCTAQKKIPYYLENPVDTAGKTGVKSPALKIQKNDLLFIHVYSMSTKPEISDAIYNLPSGDAAGQVAGFLVDVNGNIEYPQLGTIHAEGLTKEELAAEIKKRLTQPVALLLNPSVIIRFMNYKITVLGQVGKEGVVNVPGEKINIFEAVGLAGGITDYGKKNNVKIIREYNGKREIGIIDLSSQDVFQSPYYHLMQNDIVLVEPTPQKARQVDQAILAQRISFALGVITSAAFIYNIFK